MKRYILVRVGLCLLSMIWPMQSCVASGLRAEAESDSSRSERMQDPRQLLRVLVKEGDRVRLEASGQVLRGRISYVTDQWLILEDPSDSLEIRRIETLSKRSDRPGDALLTGALVGGVMGALTVAGGNLIPVGLGFVFGAMFGAGIGFVVSIFLPKWSHVFPVAHG